MSDVTDILTSVVDIKRFTASVVDGHVVASSLAPSRQPGRAARLEVSLHGCVYSGGLVSLNGNVNEQISFSADGAKVGIKDFSSLAGITIAGITGGTISVRAVSDMGQPINQETLVVAGLSVRFFQNTGFTKDFQAGQQITTRRVRIGMMMENDQPNNIYQNDYVYSDYGMVAGITLMKVDFYEAIYDFDGATHHFEAWLATI